VEPLAPSINLDLRMIARLLAFRVLLDHAFEIFRCVRQEQSQSGVYSGPEPITLIVSLSLAVNPHLFRDCAIYTIATEAGDRMGIGSGLLQHTNDRTIEKCYNGRELE